MVLPPVAGTTSPLMNSPSGCSYFCPFGVVIFLNKDMSECVRTLEVAKRRNWCTGNCWPDQYAYQLEQTLLPQPREDSYHLRPTLGRRQR
jgi:hypothetical protein